MMDTLPPLFTTQKSGEVVQAGIDEATSAIETVGSVIARSDLNAGDRQVANVTIFFKVAVGKRPIDLRVGSLVVTYHDPRTSIENVYTSNATAPVISFSSPGVIVKQIVGDGDHLIEFGELWSITVGISEMQHLGPIEVFTIQLKPVIGLVLKAERRLPPSLRQNSLGISAYDCSVLVSYAFAMDGVSLLSPRCAISLISRLDFGVLRLGWE